MHDHPTGKLTLNELRSHAFSGVIWVESTKIYEMGQKSTKQIYRKDKVNVHTSEPPPTGHLILKTRFLAPLLLGWILMGSLIALPS